MNPKRVFFIMLGALGLVIILGIGGTIVGNTMLKKKAASLLDLKLQNRLLDEQQTALIQANKDVAKYADLERIANSIVPQDKDQAKTVREIVQIGSETGVTFASISFPASTLGQVQPKVVTTPGDTTTPAAPAAPPVTQVKPVDGLTGVYQLEINVQSDTAAPVPYENFINFLTKLEQRRRTAQVTNISVQPAEDERGKVTFSLTINVFVKP